MHAPPASLCFEACRHSSAEQQTSRSTQVSSCSCPHCLHRAPATISTGHTAEEEAEEAKEDSPRSAAVYAYTILSPQPSV